jgi:hypothetical protein
MSAIELRIAPAQETPGAVAGQADDRLHQQSRQRRGQPQNRDLIGPRAQVFVDGAHVCHLQSPTELDTEKAETQIPNLPERTRWLFHGFDSPVFLGRNKIASSTKQLGNW